MSGRPQTYVGSLEDRVVEAQAIGEELSLRHDPREFQALRAQAVLLDEALDLMGFDDRARGFVERARSLNHQLQRIDLPENQKHRVLARGEASA